MAERRMFAKTVITSDAFLEMPHSTQNLYFHLSISADDDGFVANPKSIMRSVGAKDDDIDVLLAKQFIFAFESGIVVIKHWNVHNHIRADRYKQTQFLAEKQQISELGNGEYILGLPSGNQTTTKDRIGKNRLDKDSLDEARIEEQTSPHKKFNKPTLDEIDLYCRENNYNIEPQAFIDFYDSKGWLIGKNPMKDWKAAVRTWARRPQFGTPPKSQSSQETSNPFLNIALRGSE